jgi:hypothetical protein
LVFIYILLLHIISKQCSGHCNASTDNFRVKRVVFGFYLHMQKYVTDRGSRRLVCSIMVHRAFRWTDSIFVSHTRYGGGDTYSLRRS